MCLTRTQAIAHLIKIHRWERGAELGIWDGRNMAQLLATRSRLHMTGADSWAPRKTDGAIRWDHRQHENNARARLLPFQRRIRILKAAPAEAAERVEDGVLDFVYFNASTSEAGLRADIAAWRPKLKPGGWMTGCNINMIAVAAAVADLVPGYATGPDTVWYRAAQGD